MEEKKIRCLLPNEIEVRVAQITKKGAQLLLYKDSRCDKRILDETFGIYGWKNTYQEIKGNLFCVISIWDEKNHQWVDKTDCGVESFSEKEKGEASDAFKRAGFNIGIGRELYTRIFYFATVETEYAGKDKNGKDKYKLKDPYIKFHVSAIETNPITEKIEKIKINDNKDNLVFSYGYKKNDNKTESQKEEMITKEQKTKLQILLSTQSGLKEKVYKQLKIHSSNELSKKQAFKVIKKLESAVKVNEDN